MSHPLWMRGLKSPKEYAEIMSAIVASFVDAWIEIEVGTANAVQSLYVASFVDAWIEITRSFINGAYDNVASFVDAWIEIGKEEETW